MNTSERVIHYLSNNIYLVICDDCLARGLRVRSSLSRMLDVLNTEYFHRAVAPCQVCMETKMSIEQYQFPEGGRKRKKVH